MWLVYFLNDYIICNPVDLCVLIDFIERKVWNFTPNLGKISGGEKQCPVHTELNYIKKRFSVKIVFFFFFFFFFEKNGRPTCCDWKVCFLFLKWFEDISYRWQSLLMYNIFIVNIILKEMDKNNHFWYFWKQNKTKKQKKNKKIKNNKRKKSVRWGFTGSAFNKSNIYC